MDSTQATKELSSEDPEKRLAAAQWLAQQSTLDAQGTLAVVDTVADPEEQVREWSVAALESLENPSPSLVGELSMRLHGSADDIAYWAATLLGRMEGEAGQAGEALARLLDNEQASLHLRERAAWALGKIGGEAGAEALRRAAKSEHPRLASLARRATGAE